MLAVDDNATNSRILRDILTYWKMRPRAVASGAAALAELRCGVEIGEPFDLVLLDAMMPGLDGFAVASRMRADRETAQVPVLMLTSSGELGEIARSQALGIASYLIKPIKQSDLLDAILNVLGSHSAEAAASAAPVADVAACPPMHVLLVEDNAINQRLVTRMLEPRGHTVEVAGNGRQALAALERQRFDLVLMDVQMPEMDGFEATAAIRARERGSGEHAIIVAMTAHAMKGDRERCLLAGMDAYIAKPVDREEMLAILARFSPPRGQCASPPAAVGGQAG